MTENTGKASPPVEPIDEAPSRDQELVRLGITSHVHTSYEWYGYRYSNASDAIAAAKRGSQ